MTKRISCIVLAAVALVAIIGLILFFSAQNQGAVTYHQLIQREPGVFVDYGVCDNAPCGRQAVQIGEAYIGDAVGTTNAICQCPDGSTYQIDQRRRY